MLPLLGQKTAPLSVLIGIPQSRLFYLSGWKVVCFNGKRFLISSSVSTQYIHNKNFHYCTLNLNFSCKNPQESPDFQVHQGTSLHLSFAYERGRCSFEMSSSMRQVILPSSSFFSSLSSSSSPPYSPFFLLILFLVSYPSPFLIFISS